MMKNKIPMCVKQSYWSSLFPIFPNFQLLTFLCVLRKPEKIKYLRMYVGRYTQLFLWSVDKGRVPRKSRV